MNFRISGAVRAKLQEKHGVSPKEVYECFMNREGSSFTDTRADHLTDPPTQWFIAETDCGRKLKVIYVQYDGFFAIKSAYPANDAWIAHYEELCQRHA